MTDQDQYDSAREMNSTFKDAVGALQLEVLEGEWQIAEDYGQTPIGCTGGTDTQSYRFEMTRITPEGWRLHRTPVDLAEGIAVWFDENGWTDVTQRAYAGGITENGEPRYE